MATRQQKTDATRADATRIDAAKADATRIDAAMIELAAKACERARSAGADEARAVVARGRVSQLEYRGRKVDTLKESTERALDLTVYLDGRYSTNSTNDLRDGALDAFIRESVAMTRYLGADPHRHLPDPRFYAGRRDLDLELYDDRHDAVQPDSRHAVAREIESAALERGGDAIISVSAYYGDVTHESAMVASNGFQGSTRRTSFWCGAEATASDEGDRRPEDGWNESCRLRGDLGDPATIGRRAVERALRRVGAERIATTELPVIVENRAALRLAHYFRQALDGRTLQQRMSFLEGKQNALVMAPELSVVDDPFVPRGQGSRLYDDEGLSAQRFSLIDHGRLRNFYIDTYYAGKLGVEPTTGGSSNVVFEWHGDQAPRGIEAWMRELGRGILVSQFIGGNSNSATGDFSTGVSGFLFGDGVIVRPITGLNLAGNHGDFWQRLVGLGDDPYPFSSVRIPSLVFDRMVVAGG